MKKVLLLTALLAPALLASSARAADPALVAGVEKNLRDDEKAFLAAILTHSDVSAQFDADAALALKDPKNMGPFMGVLRAKMEAYAEVDAKGPNPNLEGHYANYAQLMTPEQRAYMVRRLPTMSEENRNSLIGYLKSVNDALAKDGQLTWYTKKVVSGIMDHYREDLNTYVATPVAQTAKREAGASAAAFAAIQKVDEDSRQAAARPATPAPAAPADVAAAKPVKPVKAPAAHPAPPAKPVQEPAAPVPAAPAPQAPPAAPSDGSVVTTNPAGGALDQLRNADRAGQGAGQVFDGSNGTGAPVGAGAAVTAPGGARPGSVLTPSTGDPKNNVAGTIPVPSPVPAEANFMDSINKMQTGPAPTPFAQRVAPIAAGVIGGLLGALIGFLVAGPIGAAIGAGAGIVGGATAGHFLAKHLFQ